MVANAIIPQNSTIVEVEPSYVKKQVEKIRTLQKTIKSVLKDKVDYGKIQGCGDKPTLFKSGAEKVCITFSLQDSYEIIESKEDYSGNGFFAYTVKCYLFSNGVKITEGLGCCNSKESKFRYKWVTEKNLPIGIDVSQLEKRKKKGQYGEYVEYRVEDDACSKSNTIIKMAKKRAKIDAVLGVANLSELFTQDFDDIEELKETTTDKVEEIKEQIKNTEQIQTETKLICSDCGKEIPKNAYDYSTSKYGMPLCFNCQNKHKN